MTIRTKHNTEIRAKIQMKFRNPHKTIKEIDLNINKLQTICPVVRPDVRSKIHEKNMIK